MFLYLLFPGKDEINLVLVLCHIIGRISTESTNSYKFPFVGESYCHVSNPVIFIGYFLSDNHFSLSGSERELDHPDKPSILGVRGVEAGG